MGHKDEVKSEYKSAFEPSWDKPEVKKEEVKPVVKEAKKEETVVELLLRLLRGHGHIFNSYEIKLLEGEAPAKKIVETYTDVKASRKLHPEKFVVKKK